MLQWNIPNNFQIKEAIDWNQIEWPILVLRGNGEVLIVRGNVLLKKYEQNVFINQKKLNIRLTFTAGEFALLMITTDRIACTCASNNAHFPIWL